MSTSLDTIHHTAIQVENIARSVRWYTDRFACEIAYQDDSWAMLRFAKPSLALVLPEQHPYHFAILAEDLTPYGKAVPHRAGTASVYIKDADGNNVEMLTVPGYAAQ